MQDAVAAAVESAPLIFYPIDAEDYRIPLNLRTKEKPLIVTHIFRRLSLAEWQKFEDESRVTGKKARRSNEEEYSSDLTRPKFWLWNLAAARVQGYPQPIAPDRDAEQPVAEAQKSGIPAFHKERAIDTLLDVQCQVVHDDEEDEAALLLGTSEIKLRVQYLGFTFYFYFKRPSEADFVSYDKVVRASQVTEAQITTFKAKVNIEAFTQLFDRMFSRAEAVTFKGAPYVERERAEALTVISPLIKRRAIAGVFDHLKAAVED